MDMSFSLDDAVPLAPSSLGYPALLAAIRDVRGAVPSAHDAPLEAYTGSPAVCLAKVLLGRPGWREASLALGGSFAGGSLTDVARRKPV